MIQIHHRAANIKVRPPLAVLRNLDINIPLLWRIVKQM